MFKKDQAQRILEHAAFEIGGEVFLEVEFLDALDGFRIVTDFAKNLPGFAGVELFQVVPPPEVAGAIHRVAGAGNGPAAKVLAAGGEAEGFGGIRAEPEHPIEKAAGQEQFARLRNSLDDLGVWIASILLVEAAKSTLEAGIACGGGWRSVCGHRKEAKRTSDGRLVQK